MKVNQNLLVGIGLGVFALYLLNRKNKNKQQAITNNPKVTATEETKIDTLVMPLPTVSGNSSNNRIISSNITQEERTAIQEALKQSGKKYHHGNPIVETKLGNFKYVVIKEGSRRGLSLGSAPIYDWVRTTDKPQVYAAPSTRTIGELR